jgi:hypothetical protein
MICHVGRYCYFRLCFRPPLFKANINVYIYFTRHIYCIKQTVREEVASIQRLLMPMQEPKFLRQELFRITSVKCLLSCSGFGDAAPYWEYGSVRWFREYWAKIWNNSLAFVKKRFPNFSEF